MCGPDGRGHMDYLISDAFIAPPTRIPWMLRLGLWIVRRRTGTDLLPPRLLAWYPRAAVASGLLESLITHRDRNIDERMLKMVRMTVSFTASCPFCVGMNSEGWEKLITPEERAALQGSTPLVDIETLTPRERLAIKFARLTSQTPLALSAEFGQRMIGLVVVAAGVLDVCLLAPLAGRPFAGPRFRASFAG